jgi:N-sulfoglucosamine sulfohydrolase
MYYPMRAVVTPRYKLIVNLAHEREYPHPSDLWASATWQSVLKSKDPMMGQRSVKGFLNRPREELYDLQNDPNELRNLANETEHAETLADLRRRLRTWQQETNDPWNILYRNEDPKFNR